MKKNFLSLFVIFILVACTNEASFEDRSSQLQDEIISAIEPLSDDIKDDILIPSKLLSEKYIVDFGYSSEPVNDPSGKIFQSFLIFTD
ncbi:hypothetical protein V7111_25645 [Neobacillus niacini]|uniref:hypothetical protein n=1 Tax=Neobacillus niacini TaxID=86668 RepID=UPI003001FB9C